MKTNLLKEAEQFINSLPDEDSAKLFAQLQSLENGWTEGLMIKPLKDKIKELIVSRYRIVFFTEGDIIYVVDSFRKKSQKTPVRIIERAERIHRCVIEMKKKKRTK